MTLEIVFSLGSGTSLRIFPRLLNNSFFLNDPFISEVKTSDENF